MTDAKGSGSGKASRLDEFMSNYRRALWKLAIPVMFGMAVQTIYSIADMIFVGRISSTSIAALAFVFPLMFFSIGITFGLGSGVTAVIAQFIGARDQKRASNAAEHGVLLAVVIGLFFSAGGLIWGRKLLTVLGATENILPEALAYFNIIAGGLLLQVMAVLFRSIFNGEGNTRTPMIVQSVGVLLNIILDPILIFGLNMGISGAALATVISQLVVASILGWLMFVRKQMHVQFKPASFHFSRQIISRILVIGIPASLSMVIMSVGAGIFNYILIHFSEHAVAGYQVAGRLDQIFFLPVMAIAGSLVTLVGMFYGARRIDLIRAVSYYGMGRAVLIGFITAIVFWISAPWVFQIFTDDPEIQQVAIQYIRTLAFFYPFIAVGMTSGRILQGLGSGMPSLILTAIRVALISAPLSWFTTMVLDKPIRFVWYSMIMAILVSSNMAHFWLRYRFRKAEREFVPEGE